MIEPIGPIGYKLNPEKLKKAPQGILPYLFLGAFYYTEDYEYFDVIKDYLDIPKPRKSLEEIQQEFDAKIDEQIEDVKYKFEALKYRQEYQFSKKITQIIENIEYAHKNGRFPEKLTLLYDDNLSVTGVSYASSNFVIKSGGKEVGYYTTGDGYLRYSMNKKPNFINRFCMNKLLNFRWVDK